MQTTMNTSKQAPRPYNYNLRRGIVNALCLLLAIAGLLYVAFYFGTLTCGGMK